MKEIIIYPDPQNDNNAKGNFFEDLLRRILKQQRYDVKQRINFTGMEIDLLCQHLDRNETAYVECKATESLTSSQIQQFCFKVQHKKADYGYFVYVRDFQHQAGGTIIELEQDNRYKNLTFWNGEKVIDLLISCNEIKAFDMHFKNYTITKVILLYSHFGIFYVPILSRATLPEFFSIYEAKTLTACSDEKLANDIKDVVKDISTLNLLKDETTETFSKTSQAEVEIAAEIQESEAWDDYKPASAKFFVGRDSIKRQLMDFLSEIIKNKTIKRIFYIDGKSGWGKSSFINALRGQCRNKFNKNKYFVFAVDSRSANSENFIALSFKKMVDKAVRSKFMNFDCSKLRITSNYDILGDHSISDLTQYLSTNNKLLIIIFDQFEDIFRKGGLFKVFYKFLYDLRESGINIVLGFSWKSEINVPIDHEAYYLWQQAKEYTDCFSILEFDFKESLGIVKQLEKSLQQKLDLEFKRKIINHSQGFPWLVKKLCIHIFKQHSNGLPLNDLLEQDFNVELLFKDDLEGLTPNEIRALNFVAKRSFDNDAFDATELDETLSEDVLNALINKRLVIKSGTKYNVYWDIFRDYLVTTEIPKIGETYLVRQGVQSVVDTFLCFKDHKSLTLSDFPSMKGEGATENSLRELIYFGLVTKQNNSYSLKRSDVQVDEESFKNYIHVKLENHTLYIEILKLTDENISLSQISRLIKSVFKEALSEKTLETYARIFINWLKYANLRIPNLNPELSLELQNTSTFTPQFKPNEDVAYFETLNDMQAYSTDSKSLKILYDLKSIGLVSYNKGKVYLTPTGKGIIQNKTQIQHNICREALKTEKIKKAYEIIKSEPTIKKKEFKVRIADLLVGINSHVYQNETIRNLYSWGKFVHSFVK